MSARVVIGGYALLDGVRVKIVGYREKVRGPIVFEPGPWVVVVEQSGDYRMGTVRPSDLTDAPAVTR